MTVQQHLISLQRLLERRAHERVTRTRLRQCPEMNVEKGEIHDCGYNDETEGTSHEMTGEVFLHHRYSVLRTKKSGKEKYRPLYVLS